MAKMGRGVENGGGMETFFLKTTGSELTQVTFNMFRERSGLVDCVPYDYRHLWCTWIGNHKVSYYVGIYCNFDLS